MKTEGLRQGWQRPRQGWNGLGRVRVVRGATGRTYARIEARTVDEGKNIGNDRCKDGWWQG